MSVEQPACSSSRELVILPDRLHCLTIVSACVARASEDDVARHVAPGVVHLDPDVSRLLGVLDRGVEVADRSEIVGEPAEDPAEPEAIAQRARDRFRLTQSREAALEFPEAHQRRLLLDDRVDESLRPHPIVGEIPKALEGGIERCDGLAVCRMITGRTARHVEMTCRVVPHLGVTVMQSQRERVRSEVSRVERLDPFGHAPVNQLSPRCEHPAPRHVADAVVREVEPLALALQDTPAHELFDAGGRLLLAEAGRTLEKGKLESAADHRGHGSERLRAL